MPAAEQPEASFTNSELNHLFRDAAGISHVALAVSGGSDSTALMALAQQWAKQLSQPPRLSVLTVDHGLREGSFAEAESVAQWAKALGVEHTILRWIGDKPTSRIQETARQARYDLMTEWCRSHGAAALLIAHNIEDQAETIIMRLARGTGIEGLAGMHRVRLIDGTALYRPLLHLSRERLRSFLRARGQRWIDDPSNENTQFERVRIRKAELDEEPVTAPQFEPMKPFPGMSTARKLWLAYTTRRAGGAR